MEFVGEVVKHKSFGLGKVTEFRDTFIVVKFDSGSEKDFVYPDAFDKFLELKNQELARQVDEKLVIYRQKKAEKKIKEEESRKEILRLKMIRDNIESAKKSIIKKIDSNIAFKCNYCDGGQENNGIGYKAICSDETINYNINIAKNKICSAPESHCYKYLQGLISRNELDLKNDENNYYCNESQLLKEWQAYSDISFIKTNDLKAKKLKNVNYGSLVLLTTVMPNEKEKDRIIFGFYLLEDNYSIDYNTKGYLGAHEKYRMQLSIEEAKKFKFWDYYFNEKNPEKIANNSGLYRYFDDIQSAQALKTLTEIKKDTDQEAIAMEIFEYYCESKNIEINSIPELKGALQVNKSI